MAIPFNLPSDEETEENYRRLDQLLTDLYVVLREILLRPRHYPVPSSRMADTSDFTQTSEQNFEPPSDASSPDLMEERLMALPDLVRSAMTSDLGDLAPNRFLGSDDLQCDCDESTTASSISTPKRRMPDVVDSPVSQVRPPRPSTKKFCKRSRSPSFHHSSKVGHSSSKTLRTQKKWVHVGEELRSIAEDFRSSFQMKTSNKTERPSRNPEPEFKASSLFSLLVPSPFGKSVWTTVIFIVGWRLITRLQ